MPVFEVVSPEGTKYRVNAPEGATQDQAIAYVQSNFAPKPKRDPYAEAAGEQTGTQNFLAGVGGGMRSLYLGGKQMLGLDSPGEVDEHKRAMAGLNTTGAGKFGDIAGQVAMAAPTAFIPGANSALGATLLGGGLGALQPTADGESRTANMAIGAGGGLVGKVAADKLVRVLRGSGVAPGISSGAPSAGPTPGPGASVGNAGSFMGVGEDISAGLNVPTRVAADNGRAIGMRLTPGQASGSRALQQLEAKLESQPMTSGPFSQIKANNQTVLNRTAANAIGETSDTLDSHVLDQARERIGGIYRMVADQKPRTIDPDQFIGRLSGIESDFEGLLPGSITDNPLTKQLFSFAEKGQATGEQLQNLASKLGKAANNQMTSANGDRQLGMALFQVKDMADDLLASGLSGDTAKAFSAARSQCRNLMLLTQRNGVINPTTGNVNGNALAGLLQQKDRNGFLFGGNESPMYTAARFSQAFRPIVGDSGTATRMPIPSPTDFVLSLPFNLVSRAYTSQPVINAASGAARVSREGLAPRVGGLLDQFLPQAAEINGGLLGARSGN